MSRRLGPISIGDSPALMAKVEDAYLRLDKCGEDIGAEVMEELGPVGALMVVLSAHGAAIMNIFKNQAHSLGVEWSKKERNEFGLRLQAMLQEQNQKLVARVTGDSN